MATQVTLLSPVVNTEPEGGVQTTGTELLNESVAVTVQVTGVFPRHSAMMLVEQTITGPTAGVIVMRTVAVLMPPWPSPSV